MGPSRFVIVIISPTACSALSFWWPYVLESRTLSSQPRSVLADSMTAANYYASTVSHRCAFLMVQIKVDVVASCAHVAHLELGPPCPECRSDDTQRLVFDSVNGRKWILFCNDCGHVSRSPLLPSTLILPDR